MGQTCCNERTGYDTESVGYLQVEDKAKNAAENIVPVGPESSSLSEQNLLKKKKSMGIAKTGSLNENSAATRIFRSGDRDINSVNYDFQEFEKLRHEEKLDIPSEISSRIPKTVIEFLRSQPMFKYRLDLYPGKSNPVSKIVSEHEGSIYFGQVGKEEFSGTFKEGKGILITEDSVFYGYFVQNRYEGPGMLVLYSGQDISCYQGFWVGEDLQGKGMLVSSHGYKYLGDWEESLQNGYGEESWPDGSCYKGDFKQGVKHGHGEFIWKNKERYVGQFSQGVIEGFGTFEWPDGNSYTGQWKNNKMEGRGRFTWPDGMEYEGQYKNGKKEGFGSLTFQDKFRWEGQWKNGKKDGNGILTTNEGERVSGIWMTDKKRSL